MKRSSARWLFLSPVTSFIFALHNLEHKKAGGYELTARFSNVDGIAPGSAVRISGVKVGTVSKVTLDPATFLATVHLELEPNLQLPIDTVASINTPSLLGEKNLSLEPGNDDQKLKPNGVIVNTESAASIEHLLGAGYLQPAEPRQGQQHGAWRTIGWRTSGGA